MNSSERRSTSSSGSLGHLVKVKRLKSVLRVNNSAVIKVKRQRSTSKTNDDNGGGGGGEHDVQKTFYRLVSPNGSLIKEKQKVKRRKGDKHRKSGKDSKESIQSIERENRNTPTSFSSFDENDVKKIEKDVKVERQSSPISSTMVKESEPIGIVETSVTNRSQPNETFDYQTKAIQLVLFFLVLIIAIYIFN
ncbi:hypothetical protein BLOT_009386 [Blomia tropicalis]|nr:hypothetical protein BLOT_009386 [Blomia tropicalis]